MLFFLILYIGSLQRNNVRRPVCRMVSNQQFQSLILQIIINKLHMSFVLVKYSS